MEIDRQAIIAALSQSLAQDAQVLAVWLEGADAVGAVDAYSDIDLCCSVKDGAIAAATSLARHALEGLGRVDLDQTYTQEKDHHHTVFHLAGTSPYLLLDFNVFVGRGSQFWAGDEIEKPLVLFDRAGVVRFKPPDRRPPFDRARLEALSLTVAQGARIEKYVRRGSFLEAFGYYHKWLLVPLVETLRMRYTPLHTDYYIVHISRHLPGPVLERLEGLFQVASLADIEIKSKEARQFFEETAASLTQ